MTPSADEDGEDEVDESGRAVRKDAGIPRGPVVREHPPSVDKKPSDWTKFSIDKSLRALKCGTAEQRRKELRKLHLRFWHAPRKPLENLLREAGVDDVTLSWIPEVIETCRACRAWAKTPDASVASVELAEKQNEKVESDIM